MDVFKAKRMTYMIVGCGICALMCGCPKKNTMYEEFEDDLAPLELDLYPLSSRIDFDNLTQVTSVSFENISFRYDNYQVDPEEAHKVEEVASYMQDQPNTYVITEGHCDERGSREYNLSLGEHRSQAVRAYLISLGVDPDRIQTRSHGEELPLDPSHGEASWRMNRRAEFALYR
jgi:outer membrane protein OmpA-like peptidoglycan-associated protein